MAALLGILLLLRNPLHLGLQSRRRLNAAQGRDGQPACREQDEEENQGSEDQVGRQELVFVPILNSQQRSQHLMEAYRKGAPEGKGSKVGLLLGMAEGKPEL